MLLRVSRLAIVAALLTAGCGGPTEPGVEVISRQRAIWAAQGIVNYSYDYTLGPTFFNQLAGRPIRIRVEQGTVVSAAFIDTGEAVPNAGTGLPTVDGLFDRLLLARQAGILGRSQFDPGLGFPTSFVIEGPSDANGTVTAGHLQPL